MNIFHIRRPSAVASNGGATGKTSLDLLQSEYLSLRAESVQSFVSAQSIIQWSLATYSVLFGGALVVVAQQIDSAYKSFNANAILLIFTVLLPGLMCAATWQWLGEITRMERIGMYLRGLERYLDQEATNDSVIPAGDQLSPLHWETFLNSEGGNHKRNAPYVGTAAMFAGAFLVSLSMAGFWQYKLFGDAWWQFPSIFWPLVGVLFIAVFFAVSIMLGRSVIVMGSERFNIATRRVEKIEKDSRG